MQIHSAVFNPGNGQWGPEQVVATREDTQRSLLRYVRKLGNPVCGRAADGKLWLFYVTVSVGGWSGSSITAKTSSDEGETWSPARRLVTSPFLDVSTLVKGTPFLYSDGTMGLPVYQELNNEFGEILRLDKNGNVIDKLRLSSGKDHGLQPVVLVKNASEALVLMRHSGEGSSHHVIAVSTHDAGQHWTAPTQLPLSNPDSAISAVVLPGRQILAVVNNQGYQGQNKGRNSLTLVISADNGVTWKTIYQFENQSETQKGQLSKKTYFQVAKKFAQLSDPRLAGKDGKVNEYAESAQHAMCSGDGCGFEFSYPYLIQTHNGDFHLAYTWNRSFIKHIWFNQAWLSQRLKESAHDHLH